MQTESRILSDQEFYFGTDFKLKSAANIVFSFTLSKIPNFQSTELKWIHIIPPMQQGFPHGSVGKVSACNAVDPASIPGSGRSPGEGNGNPLQYSCLESPMDRGAWQATLHGTARVRHDLVTKPPPPMPHLTVYWTHTAKPHSMFHGDKREDISLSVRNWHILVKRMVKTFDMTFLNY